MAGLNLLPEDRVPEESGLPMRAEHPPGPPREVPAPPEVGEPADTGDEATRLRAELDQYVDALRRSTAEFDNYRKRMLREQTTHVERAEARLVRHLLPVLDAAELGARHHPDAVGPVYRQLDQTLAAAGLRRIEPADEPFDPDEHEAVEHDAVVPLRRSATERATTIRPGYRLHGRLLRPALVRVHSS